MMCPCWMALWSAKQLSFPPDQDAMSFIFCFFLLLVLWECGVSVWMVYPALLIRVVVNACTHNC
jgi:hypothetical protein